MIAGGHFETQVYYAAEIDRFLTVRWSASANPKDWVVVGSYTTGEIVIQRYHNQAHMGVISVLESYQMPGLGRWNPETVRAYSDYNY